MGTSQSFLFMFSKGDNFRDFLFAYDGLSLLKIGRGLEGKNLLRLEQSFAL